MGDLSRCESINVLSISGLPPPGESIANILNKDDVADVHFVSRKRKSNGGGKAVSQTADDTAQQAGPSKQKKGGLGIQPIRTNVQEEMKSAVLTPAIEKKENIARLAMSDTAIRKLNRVRMRSLAERKSSSLCMSH